MKNIFVTLYRFFERHKMLMWLVLLLLALLCGWSVSRLSFVEDISSFLPQNDENARINYAYQHLGGDNKIVVNIKSTDTAQVDQDLLTKTADLFVERLLENDSIGLIKNASCEVDESQVEEITNFVLQNLPYFLTDEDYIRMDTLLEEGKIARQIANAKLLLSAPGDLILTLLTHDPLFLSSPVLQRLENFKPESSYTLYENHFFNKQGNEAIVIITSQHSVSETMQNAVLLQHIDNTITDIVTEGNGKITATSFGASQVSLTNATQIKRDSLMAVALAIAFIIALLIYYYREIRSILLIVVSVAMGGIVALGLIACLKNPVSIIAVGVASIIVCIAINYPIHVLSHLRKTNNKEQIIKEIATPLLIGNLTTVGAFLGLLFISSSAMKDLGLFAALFLLGTILFVLIFLPHLMSKEYHGRKDRELAFKRWAEFQPEKHTWLFVGLLVITVVLYAFSGRTTFDTNMHHINYMTEQQRQSFEQLLADADTSAQTLYCIAEGHLSEEALTAQEQAAAAIAELTKQGKVRKSCGVGGFLPSAAAQRERLDKWNGFWSSRRQHCLQAVSRAAQQNGFQPDAFAEFERLMTQDFEVQPWQYFNPILQNMAANYVVQDNDKTLIYNILTVDKASAESIVAQLNQLSDNIYGFSDTSIAARLVQALSKDFNYVLFICGFIVFAFLLISFGRLEITLMAFLPLVVAWIWILGLMGLMDIRFNIVNIILATFIFGQGDDYSIFVTEGLIYEYKYGKKMLSQFKNSILLSSFIMFIGIGMLIFAKHPAMKSLAEVVIIGMSAVVLMAYLLPPFIFKWMTQKKGRNRKQPITLLNFFRTFGCFVIFFIFALFITLAGFILLTLGGKNDRHKLRFHQLIFNVMKLFSKWLPVSCHIENTHNEDFSKPSVIICNHKSHLDLLYTLMLNPKIIVLTNDWAWNNPFYGIIIRYADFRPLTSGVDTCIEQLRPLTAKGYSILIFPEGTRSLDEKTLKFHEGAFYIADKLNLDILPIVLHGVGHVLPKDEFLLRRGEVGVSIRPRISPQDTRYRGANSLLAVSRLIRKYMEAEYDRLASVAETPHYFKDAVYHNYVFKGRDIELDSRKKLSKNNLAKLTEILAELPETGTILYRNCGFGQLALLASMLKKTLNIVAYDPDADKVAVARNCAQRPERLSFVSTLPDRDFDIIIDETKILAS